MHYARIVLAGLLLGAGLYYAPFFLVRFLLFGLLVWAIFRLAARPRWGWGHGRWAYAGHPGPGMQGYGPLGFADKVRAMTEEEYGAFQERFRSGYGCYGYRRKPKAQQATPTGEAPSAETPTQNP